MEQHDLTLTDHLARHQRRAVAERGDHPVGQRRIGLRHDLRGHRDIGRDAQAIKRRAFWEGRQRLRLAPAHRAPNAPPAGAQPHRHQRVFVHSADIARRKARAGKPQQHAALLDPLGQRGFFRGRQRRDIRQNDHIRIGRQDVQQRAVQQVGARLQRLMQVVQGGQQLQPLAVVPPGNQRHLAAAQRVVGQRQRPRRTLPGNREMRDPRAQLGRQRQRGIGRGFARRKGRRGLTQRRRIPRRIAPFGQNRNLALRPRHRPPGRQLDRTICKGRRRKPQHGRPILEHPDRPARQHRLGQIRAPRIIDAVPEPIGLEPARHGIQRRRHARQLRFARRPGLRDQPRQPRLPRIRRLKDHRLGFAQPHNRHRPAGAPRLGQLRVDQIGLRIPMRRPGPARVQQNQQRPGPVFRLPRVKHRPRQTHDHRRDGDHPQQQQPPGRAVADAFVVLQAQQQRHARKPAPDRRGRDGAQDDPEDRQDQ